jgi:excisionase family DNA binding protein
VIPPVARDGLPAIPMPRKAPTRFSTVAEVATFLRVSKMTVYRLIKTGELPAYQFGNLFRVPTQAVWEYMRGNKVDPDSVERAKAL